MWVARLLCPLSCHMIHVSYVLSQDTSNLQVQTRSMLSSYITIYRILQCITTIKTPRNTKHIWMQALRSKCSCQLVKVGVLLIHSVDKHSVWIFVMNAENTLEQTFARDHLSIIWKPLLREDSRWNQTEKENILTRKQYRCIWIS